MKRAMFISSVLAAALAVTAVGASAKGWGKGGHDGPRGMMNFEEVDANKDGKLSIEEMDAFAKTRFDKADTNGDGFLSAEEIKAKAREQMQRKAEKRSAKMLEHKDANKDGKLSYDEMHSGSSERKARMLDHMDTDKDGAISKEEFEQARASMKEHRGKKMNHQSN